MKPLFEARGLTRKYGDKIALNDVSLTLDSGSVVGLIGRNGCGKTTLLDHIVGLRLPSVGSCRTFGVETADLGAEELGRIGVVHQENRLLSWMTVEQHLRYVASFHASWDLERERFLLHELDLNPTEVVHKMSPGNAQKLAIVLAVCHHPQLLLLDEPVSAMDPIAREKLLSFLLEMVREDQTTAIISSHVLRDVERIVNHVVCLEQGVINADIELDDLLEGYSEWIVTSLNGGLTGSFEENFVLEQQGDGHSTRLIVQNEGQDRSAFEQRHNVSVENRALNLEAIFPHMIGLGDQH